MDLVNSSKKLNNDRVLKLIISPKFRIYRHLIWILLLAAGFSSGKVMFEEPINTFAKIGGFAILLFIFYMNMYRFVPKLLFRDKYMAYFLWMIALFTVIQVVAVYVKRFLAPYILPENRHANDESNIFFLTFMFIIITGASAAVKLFQRWIADSQKINELETNTIQAELEHLKKQINPHFLFNTLNNINVLTQKDPEKASQVVMKLSDLLRYQLYDSTRNMVFLSSEIHFLEDFLNLEKIRRDNFDFSISHTGAISGLEIPPVLFITFIENAVKHNMDAEKPSFVYLFFVVTGNELNFHCVNSKPRVKVVQNKNGGLGLANITRRLELLYPGNHVLLINDKQETFEVDLTIKL